MAPINTAGPMTATREPQAPHVVQRPAPPVGRLTIDLDVVPEAVPLVRRMVCDHLTLCSLTGLSERVALVVSELLTNVLRHTRPAARSGTRKARLTVTRLPGALHVCVRDFDPALPKPSPAGEGEEHGRGFRLVGAYADDFGCSSVTGGKDVWATFLTDAELIPADPDA
ncbi:ATP-binding protein [Streptomyces sp. NPDC047000]|uniref:ATP-binding protein n=1 Tax=Streptomyces sp. NPDC047000 TaxID=3155474 RepID=UPI003401D529